MEQKQTKINIDLNELYKELCPKCKKIIEQMVGHSTLTTKAGE